MILVDSSVWVDYFRGTRTAQADMLDRLLGNELIAIGDLILTEVLQGFVADRDFIRARRFLGEFDLVMIGGHDVAMAAAANYRTLRAQGIAVRKTIDTLIATRCIVSGYSLLYSDHDFDVFEEHLGLQCVA